MPTLMIKGNGERLVPDEKVTEYLEMGYSVIDRDGKVIKKPKPTTPAEFNEIVHAYEQEIAQKDEAILALTADNNMLKAALADLTKQHHGEPEAETAENGEYSAEEAADEVTHANSAPESETPQKGNSVTKKRTATKAADKAAE